ncbi:MAG: hypothetical protein LPK47_04965 [Bacteroidota bacterium]|nr:hypothetical protein [Bacteroidota bacterium]
MNKPVYVINNPESVVEVYYVSGSNEVREVKCLNYNRIKEYTYTVDDYLKRMKGHEASKAIQYAMKG